MLNERQLPSPIQMGFLLLVFGPALAACNQTDGFTEEQWAAIEQMEPLKGGPPPSRYNNRGDDLDLAKFGQMIYFDKDVAEAITAAGSVGQRRRHPQGLLLQLPRNGVRGRRAAVPDLARAELAEHQHRAADEPGLVRLDAVDADASTAWSSTERPSGARRPRRWRRPGSCT